MTPVPPEVVDAVEEELEEPWMALLEEFVRDSLMPASKAADASSAAEIREAFFKALPWPGVKERGRPAYGQKGVC